MSQMITPFHALNELHRELSRVFDERPLLRSEAAREASDWSPHVDIKEDENGFQVIVDVPGVAPDDVNVTVHNRVLTISGERIETAEQEGDRFRRRERFHGSFRRQFSLPEEVDEDNVNAAVKNGVLTIIIPRASEVQPRSITVTGE